MRSVASHSPLITISVPVRMGFVVDKVALGQIFLRLLLFFPVIIIPSLLHVRSFIYHRRRTLLTFYSVFK